jgi:deoxyribodipyrimidine photo-lyase
MKSSSIGLVIFFRDLRLYDHTALEAAHDNHDAIVPLFIINPEQINQSKNDYYSHHSVQYMLESLQELENSIDQHNGTLYIFQGDPEDVVDSILKHNKDIGSIYFHRDYTPFAQEREKTLQKVCKKYERKCFALDDYLLLTPENIVKSDKKPYTVFTPFYKKGLSLLDDFSFKKQSYVWYKQLSVHSSMKQFDIKKALSHKNFQMKLLVQGGSEYAKKLLKKALSISYDDVRDIPCKQTTHLSVCHKFGTLSIRHTYMAFKEQYGKECTMIKELLWRDFFTHIAYHFPHVFKGAFYKKYDSLEWNTSETLFKKWCEGKTGFPIVDAGMRQLNETGYMHNRVRMITASFLTKDLHISWRKGERYFAQHLLDYDPSVNNGNWQWAASTGCDAQPYFRIFNPWLQQKKFDPECTYIKTWIPELKNSAPKIIHTLYDYTIENYPEPCVDHEKERARAIERYKRI